MGTYTGSSRQDRNLRGSSPHCKFSYVALPVLLISQLKAVSIVKDAGKPIPPGLRRDARCHVSLNGQGGLIEPKTIGLTVVIHLKLPKRDKS